MVLAPITLPPHTPSTSHPPHPTPHTHLEEGQEAVEAPPRRALVEILPARGQQLAHLVAGGWGGGAGGGA